MPSNISKDYCWVIKVTYINHNEVNFNEAFWTSDKCKAAILKKINPDDLKILNDYTFKDMDNEIIYEMKLVDIK